MSKLNALLIRPNSAADEIIPPFGLGYLTSAAREKHNVQILDCLKEDMNADGLREFLAAKKFDVIGVQAFTHHINTANEYIEVVKKTIPEAVIIIGGPHTSACPAETFDYFPGANFGFSGEAEVGFKELLDALLIFDFKDYSLSSSAHYFQKIPGLIWKNNGKTEVNPPFFSECLDDISFPSWDLMPPDKYPFAPHGAFFKNFPVAPIIATRGCPYSCSYCAGSLISGKKIRKRSVKNIIEEIKFLCENYGIKEIHIEDDNFTFYRDFAHEFCRELIKSELNISWTCPNGVRLDTLDKELLKIMKKSGLYALSVGVESGSERILRDMKKSLDKRKIIEKTALIKKAGVASVGFFIIGYPNETKEDISETIAFAKSLPLTRATFSIFKPFPGTEITNSLIASGFLDFRKLNFSKFFLNEAVCASEFFSAKELKNIRRKALLQFYLRPKILFSLFREIKNLEHFKIVMKRIFRWLIK